MREALAAFQASGARLYVPYFFSLLADVYQRERNWKDGLAVVADAFAVIEETGERLYEAELWRLRGELTLAQSQASLGQVKTSQNKSEGTDPRPLTSDPQGDAEACFLTAIEIARTQQAKSLELRAVMSLVRLRQQQAREQAVRSKQLGVSSTEQSVQTQLAEAHQMLSDVYTWFTEGFDTKDLQEAKALLEQLHHRISEPLSD